MAVLRSGILGRASGKVAGVVGAHWKGVSYIREKVVPTNPNTTLQQAQRAKMILCVQMAKQLVGPIFNKYQDHFEKMMSGYNRFVSSNVAQFTTTPQYQNMKVVQGKLWGPAGATGVKNGANIDVTWTAGSLGSNGLATDKVFAMAFNHTSKLASFASAEVLRSAGTLTFAPPAGTTTGEHVVVYALAAKYNLISTSLLELISDSVYSLITW